MRSVFHCILMALTLMTCLDVVGYSGEPANSKQGSAELMEDYSNQKDFVTRKLNQVRVLMKLKRYQDALVICREILDINPDEARARAYQRLAQAQIVNAKDENDEMESIHRDAMVVTEVGRWSMPPARGNDVERPDLFKLPFATDATEEEKIRLSLARVIPEINVVDTDVAYVLQLLFKTHDINIIYPPAAVTDKKITLQARNISLGDILNYLSRNQGLHYTVKNGIVWLYSQDDNASEGGSALFQSEVIQLTTGLTNSQLGSQNQPSGGEGGTSEDPSGGISDVESVMEWMQESWPGWPKASSWRLDRKHNRLIICSTPDIIQDVKKVVATVDSAPTQVLITAVFVSIAERDFQQLGFNWGMSGNPQDARDPTRGTRGEASKVTIQEKNTIITPLTSYGATQTLTAGMVGVMDGHQFNMTLNALASKASTKVMNAPRVIALNNRVATIDITQTYPYVDDYRVESTSTTTDTNVASSTTLVPVWAEKEIGFMLKVLPSVGGDLKTIYLEIMPEITEHDATNFVEETIVVTNSTGPGTNETVPTKVRKPIFATKKLEVAAVVYDGGTVVIGGLIKEDKDKSTSSLPGLNKIPGLRHLFESKNKKRIRSFDLIFVTAQIVTPGNRHYNTIPEEATPSSVRPGTKTDQWMGLPTPDQGVAPAKSSR